MAGVFFDALNIKTTIRTLRVNGRYIRSYGVPKYDKAASHTSTTPHTATTSASSVSGSAKAATKQVRTTSITCRVNSSPAIFQKAKQICSGTNIRQKDALELASAEEGESDVFLTTDDRLIRMGTLSSMKKAGYYRQFQSP